MIQRDSKEEGVPFLAGNQKTQRGDAFATLAVERSCVLCCLGIVFDQVRNAQRKRVGVGFEVGAC